MFMFVQDVNIWFVLSYTGGSLESHVFGSSSSVYECLLSDTAKDSHSVVPLSIGQSPNVAACAQFYCCRSTGDRFLCRSSAGRGFPYRGTAGISNYSVRSMNSFSLRAGLN
jgi:hypothetical protein